LTFPHVLYYNEKLFAVRSFKTGHPAE